MENCCQVSKYGKTNPVLSDSRPMGNLTQIFAHWRMLYSCAGESTLRWASECHFIHQISIHPHPYASTSTLSLHSPEGDVVPSFERVWVVKTKCLNGINNISSNYSFIVRGIQNCGRGDPGIESSNTCRVKDWHLWAGTLSSHPQSAFPLTCL